MPDSTDFHLTKFSKFSGSSYKGDFGNRYAMAILDQSKSNPNTHRFLSYDFQMVNGEAVWYA